MSPIIERISWMSVLTILLACADPAPSRLGGGGPGNPPPPPPPVDGGDAGNPLDGSVDSVMVVNYEEGPGPLSPRVSNETCRLPPPPPVGAMRLRRAFPELTFNRVLWMGMAPNDDRFIYFVEQNGRVLVTDAGNPVNAKVFFEEEVRRDHNEEGLLGLAFHPDYSANGRFFIYYSASNPRRTVLSEFRRSAERETVADPTSERVLLQINQPFGNHNGGDIQFGPDGYLYVAVGDGGAADDPLGHGQQATTLLASMLRIDVDTTDPACGTPYGIPDDNPFATDRCQPGVPPIGAPEVFAWGLRNVWRMSFDDATGELWVGDVGQGEYEEIDVVENGHNYGWNRMEGDGCFEGNPCEPEEYTLPVFSYDHELGKSVTGGYIYRGNLFPELWGKYIFGDYETGRIWALERVAGSEPEVTLLTHSRNRISSFGLGPDDELFILTFDQNIQQLERAAPPPMNVEPLPERLSETGCFSDTANLVLAPGVIPFDVNSPLWTDGSHKYRAFALPEGAQITYAPDKPFVFPEDTVLIKTFAITLPDGQERRVETRMNHRGPTGWNGYSYRWDEDQQDAVLLKGKLDEDVESEGGMFTWAFPSRSQCEHCHIERLDYSIGPTTRQLNRLYDYDGVTFNQLAAMADAGYLTLPAKPSQLPKSADPRNNDETLERRVRGLLEANCASCHQPDGPADVEIDLRETTPLAETKLCNVEPLQGDLDIENAVLLAPGDPARSILVQRMLIRGKDQMPPLGSNVVDRFGSSIVGAWIQEMAACP